MTGVVDQEEKMTRVGEERRAGSCEFGGQQEESKLQ